MSIDLVRFGWILLFITPSAVELSVWIGVRVCADDVNAFIIWAMLRVEAGDRIATD
jgi:hypothetical protein